MPVVYITRESSGCPMAIPQVAMKCGISALICLALFAGCGPSSKSIVSDNARLFPDEPLKTQWLSVSQAMRTNGYVAAVTTLREIQRQPLSADQLNAVQENLRAINTRMYDEIARGDANASNAMFELKGGGR